MGAAGDNLPCAGELRDSFDLGRVQPACALTAAAEGAGFERGNEAGGRRVETGSGETAITETDRRTIPQDKAVLTGREIELCRAVHWGFPPAAARPAECGTPDDLHGAH